MCREAHASLQCNKIRDIRQQPNMVVTHSDVPDVFLWDFTKQPDHNAPASKVRIHVDTLSPSHVCPPRPEPLCAQPKGAGVSTGHASHTAAMAAMRTAVQGKKNIRNTPDLKLVGHREMAPFALSTSSASPSIASGGEDTNVLVWNLEDQGEGDANRATRGAFDALEARATLTGHNAMVSDVCFKPASDSMLVSSADDHVVKLWDTREGKCIQDVRSPLRAAGRTRHVQPASSRVGAPPRLATAQAPRAGATGA